MTKQVFWNRRSGKERRMAIGPDAIDRRSGDRRQLQNNGYMLVVGEGGFDSFELLGVFSLVGVSTLLMVGSYLV